MLSTWDSTGIKYTPVKRSSLGQKNSKIAFPKSTGIALIVAGLSK